MRAAGSRGRHLGVSSASAPVFRRLFRRQQPETSSSLAGRSGRMQPRPGSESARESLREEDP